LNTRLPLSEQFNTAMIENSPRQIDSASGNAGKLRRPSSRGSGETPTCRFLFGDAAGDVFHHWLENDMRAARLSPAFRAYYRVRSLLPLAVRQSLQRRRRVNSAGEWYLPSEFMHALAQQVPASGEGVTTIHPWPDGNDFAFVLTHDVETAEGMRRIPLIADLEQELGFRSSWNLVPYKYPIDTGLLRELRERGFEIGVHGYNHDGRLFSSRAVFEQRLPAIQAALESFGAVGFRAPMVHRNLVWLQGLEIDYDASCFDVDPFQAMPGGVGGVWPFLAGRFVELPYTLPQDHTLFVALGQRDGRIWSEKLAYLAGVRGMALVITHPDYLDSEWRIDIYRRMLEEVHELGEAWHALPKDVAAWWRERDQLSLRSGPDHRWAIQGRAAARARVVTIHSTGKARGSAEPATAGEPSNGSPPLRFEDKSSSPRALAAAASVTPAH
jgi:peptidoglycan/xylan/chitin deacetylase (PgdA/CDA1 family)